MTACCPDCGQAFGPKGLPIHRGIVHLPDRSHEYRNALADLYRLLDGPGFVVLPESVRLAMVRATRERIRSQP